MSGLRLRKLELSVNTLPQAWIISLTVLYQVFTSVARGTRVASDYSRAVQIAETQMALLSSRVANYGDVSGMVDDYFLWKTTVKSYSPPANSPLAGDALISATERGQQPFLLTVNVSWGQGDHQRVFELNTIRLESGL